MRRPPLPGPLLPGLLLPGLLLLGAAAPPVRAGEVEDSTFEATVAHPAFTDRHPVVMIDEAHHDYLTMGGRYRALAGLLASDGLVVVPGRQPFTARSLDSCQVLVVADAAGAADVTGKAAARPAFLAGECDAVRDWVRRGGALLLIADHYPFGSAMDSLGLRFGVSMGKSATMDAREADSEVALLILEGEGVFTGGPQEVPFKAGALAIMPVSEPHGLKAGTRCACWSPSPPPFNAAAGMASKRPASSRHFFRQ